MRKYAALLLLLSIVSVQHVSAQNLKDNPRYKYLIFGSFTLPHGDFGYDIGSSAYITRRNGYYFGDLVGLASDGWGVGAEVYLPVNDLTRVDWVFSGQFLMNSPNVSEIQNVLQNDIGDSLQLRVNFSDWINIPIMTGMRYRQEIFKDVDLYAELQGGINVSKEPDRKFTISGSVAENTKFNPYIGFGFNAAIGMILFHRYNLSVRYLDLGTPSFTGSRTLSPHYFPSIVTIGSNVPGDQRRVNMFQIIVGIEL